MVDDWVIKTMYATKRRRKNPKSNKPTCSAVIQPDHNVKSNPSKRHRERLNSELEHLASLLPFEQNVIVKLDKLSILRLAVSYLRIKCYFHALSFDRLVTENRLVSHLYHCPFDLTRIEGEACLQALNGFIFIMSCDGEVFSVSRTVEHYLGFHQADILHQSVLELIHSEDREEFRRQLSWKSMLPPEFHSSTLHDLMTPETAHYLKRQFTVRFRCLLDNTSGFITLELSGRLQFLHGQARSMQLSVNSEQANSCNNTNISNKYNTSCTYNVSTSNQHNLPPLGFFAVCSPLGPLPSLNGPQRDATFKTKHQLDLTIITIDARARLIFNYSDSDLQNFKVYDLIHPDDLRYVARGHKNIIYLFICLEHFSNEEGMELLIRRTDEYKLPFPLLEPETLLNGEELTTCNNNLHMDINSPFPTGQMKIFDHHHILGSNDQKLYGTNVKSDNKINLSSKHTPEHFSSLDISGRVYSRHSTDTINSCMQMERGITRSATNNYGDDFHLSGLDNNLLEHCLNKSTKQSKVISATVLRRKRTMKEITKSEVNKCKLNHRGSCTTACTYVSNAQTPGQLNYGTNICQSTYLPLGFNQTLSRDSEAFYRNPYLCWPTNTNSMATSENINSNRLNNSEHIPQLNSSKVGLFMINSHYSSQDLNEFNMQDYCTTRNYPTAYDAYSAAVAAAAVVAAATNSYQEIKHPRQHGLNSSHFLPNTNESNTLRFQQTLNDPNIFDLQRRQQQIEYSSSLIKQQAIISSSIQPPLNNCTSYILSNNYFPQEQLINKQSLSKACIQSNNSYTKEFLKPRHSDSLNSLHQSQIEIDVNNNNSNTSDNNNSCNKLGQSVSSYTSMNVNQLFPEDDYRNESTYEQKDTSANMYLQHNVEQGIIYANPIIDKGSSSTYSSYSSPPNLISPHNTEIGLEPDSGISQHQQRQIQTSTIVRINSQFIDPNKNSSSSSKCSQFYDSNCSINNWTVNSTHTNYNQ
ncbi:unnamed protein product [Schistosoma mattheei]|uniref:Aryl hydrocarbon receptor n=1 Tax=Schistosoma mattheei TaxID=31246 RepID=A0AA85AXZ5_9TREM|nr:unnamed protein product [Schistosoma mattheei]